MPLGLCYYFIYFQKKEKQISTLIFLWLHNQVFYKSLQKQVLHTIPLTKEKKFWADVGCSTGLMSRLAHKLGYHVVGYDINIFSLLVARLLSFTLKNIRYDNKDFTTLTQKFDIVSATSLLSVVNNKIETLNALVKLLKNETSILIIIEPTEKMCVENVKRNISDFKSWWYYKGLLLWAKARKDKAVSIEIYENLKNVNIVHKYHLNSMVRVTYIHKISF